jgi:hypothetical protein
VHIAVSVELDAKAANRSGPDGEAAPGRPRMKAWRSLVNESLRTQIERWILPPDGSRGGFERFWRKARPRVRYEAKQGIFVLPDESFGLD